MQDVFRAIGRLSQSNVTVLITGESGTGKELVARAAQAQPARQPKALRRHQHRGDPQGPAGERAVRPRARRLHRRADHAPRPLRAGRRRHAVPRRDRRHALRPADAVAARAQRRQFYRVGGHNPMRANVRVIAATHQNLEGPRAPGRFREDLFHRLNVIRLRLPPLRERREDIPALARSSSQRAPKNWASEPSAPTGAAIADALRLPRQRAPARERLPLAHRDGAGAGDRAKDLPPELSGEAVAAPAAAECRARCRRCGVRRPPVVAVVAAAGSCDRRRCGCRLAGRPRTGSAPAAARRRARGVGR